MPSEGVTTSRFEAGLGVEIYAPGTEYHEASTYIKRLEGDKVVVYSPTIHSNGEITLTTSAVRLDGSFWGSWLICPITSIAFCGTSAKTLKEHPERDHFEEANAERKAVWLALPKADQQRILRQWKKLGDRRLAPWARETLGE